jgi:hypothetical protein
MAIKTTWDVEHTCGHLQAHDLSTIRISDRAGYARWLATKDCSDCWHAERERQTNRQRDQWIAARRAEEGAEVEAWEALAGMAVLDGSDRSMDWGRRVRRALLVAAYDTLGLDDAEFAARIEAPARLIKPASWWIDQRDSEPADLEELLNDAACNYAAAATQSPY